MSSSQPGNAVPAQRDITASIPRGIRLGAAWSWRLLLIAALIAVVCTGIVMLRTVTIPVAIALLLTVLLAPLQRFFITTVRMKRALATATTLVVAAAVVAGLLALAGTTILKGFAELQTQLIAGFNSLLDWLSAGPLALDSAKLDAYLDEIMATVEANQSTIVSGAIGVASSIGQFAAGTLISIFCVFFFLYDGRRIWLWLVNLLPRAARPQTHEAGRRGLVSLSAYAKTQVLVAGIDAVGIGLGSAIFVPHLALPLGILVFLGSFVPIVGAIVTGLIACLVVLVAKGLGAAIVMLIIVLAVQQLEGNVLQPFIMGHAVSLHPLAVLLVVTAGAFLAGIVGALLAVPIAAVANSVILYLRGHDKFPELGTDPAFDRLRAQDGQTVTAAAPARPAPAIEDAERDLADDGGSGA